MTAEQRVKTGAVLGQACKGSCQKDSPLSQKECGAMAVEMGFKASHGMCGVGPSQRGQCKGHRPDKVTQGKG